MAKLKKKSKKKSYKKTFKIEISKATKFNKSIATLIASSPYINKKRKTQLIKEWLKK